MLHVVLVEPEIAPNVGNVARTCAATGCRLHLVGPLGFHLDDKSLRRASVDYWSAVDWVRYCDWQEFIERVGTDARLWLFTARGGLRYHKVAYQNGDYLVFGCESRGLPETLLKEHRTRWVYIPMPGGRVRGLNLATAVGIAVFRALETIGALEAA
ncbi:MAG: tRNA (cytidine(34)-2'-O)-methyltransferase [Gemmatales bacterium]|nr:tRNA (cytidine(34)-2'-O)-methyltransferase [Gemmatales bacterium]MDW7994855.1 tRNA (cytidine(34)-2'-O)-methyltransferase [Gemmatales bacterium]